MTKPSGNRQHVPHGTLPFLTEADRLTLDAMFSQPLPYIGWNRILALFDALGTVEPQPGRDSSLCVRWWR